MARSRRAAGAAAARIWARTSAATNGGVVLVVALVVLDIATVLVAPDGPPLRGTEDWLVSVAVIMAIETPLLLRHRFPRGVFAVVSLSAAVAAVLWPVVTMWGTLVALYTLATLRPRRESIPGLAVLAGFIGLYRLWQGDPLTLAGDVAVLIGVWLLGERRLASQQRAQRRESEQAAQARLSAEMERRHLARELHDSVAHHVGAIAVQAGAAASLATHDARQAGASLALIQEAAEHALTDLRGLLDVLLDSGPRASMLRTIAELPALAQQSRHLGVDVALTLDPATATVPPGLQHVGYRVVQEALTNVHRYARTSHVDVVVTNTGRELRIDVTDTAPLRPAPVERYPAAGGGTGLAGLRERVASCGGEFRYGPLPGGGWAVTACLPLSEPPEDVAP